MENQPKKPKLTEEEALSKTSSQSKTFSQNPVLPQVVTKIQTEVSEVMRSAHEIKEICQEIAALATDSDKNKENPANLIQIFGEIIECFANLHREDEYGRILIHDLKGGFHGIQSLYHLFKSEHELKEDLEKTIIQVCNKLIEDIGEEAEKTARANKILAKQISNCQMDFTTYGISVVDSNSDSLAGIVIENAPTWKRIVFNVIRNACQALKQQKDFPDPTTEQNPHPKVTVSTEIQEKNLIVTIEDNGPGIPEDIRKDIFENQIPHSTKKTGLGIALILSQQLAKKAGGNLTLAKTSKKGTTMTVTIPISELTSETPLQISVPPATPSQTETPPESTPLESAKNNLIRILNRIDQNPLQGHDFEQIRKAFAELDSHLSLIRDPAGISARQEFIQITEREWNSIINEISIAIMLEENLAPDTLKKIRQNIAKIISFLDRLK